MTEQQPSSIRRFALGFKYAIQGIVYVVGSQRNARIHLLISAGVLILGIWLRIGSRDWATLILAMSVVWVAEFVNTAIETHLDMTTPEENTSAKIAKDVAAGAVLVGAIGAIIVGLLVLGPPLFDKFS